MCVIMTVIVSQVNTSHRIGPGIARQNPDFVRSPVLRGGGHEIARDSLDFARGCHEIARRYATFARNRPKFAREHPDFARSQHPYIPLLIILLTVMSVIDCLLQ